MESPLSTEVFPLRGRVRHYGWGGHSYLPDLLGQDGAAQPFAEYWLGAHPGDPAEVKLGADWVPLDTLVQDQPERWLGPQLAAKTGELPFLMKLLDVSRPLSIQVHPNAAQAKAGFAAEDKAGLAADDPRRNFKDQNPKPELAIALSEFFLLYGFKSESAIASGLSTFPSLEPVLNALHQAGLRSAFQTAMTADEETLAQWLLPVFDAARSMPGDTGTPQYWIAQWRELHQSSAESVDRGVFGFLMMNLMRLKPDQSIFQDANVPHAYLRGQCAEIMPNSDNVLRGGLTPKHVDVPALMSHIEFRPLREAVRQPPPTLTDFAMAILVVADDRPIHIRGPACLLLLDGQVTIDQLSLRRGMSAFVTGAGEKATALGSGKLICGRPGR